MATEQTDLPFNGHFPPDMHERVKAHYRTQPTWEVEGDRDRLEALVQTGTAIYWFHEPVTDAEVCDPPVPLETLWWPEWNCVNAFPTDGGGGQAAMALTDRARDAAHQLLIIVNDILICRRKDESADSE